MNGHLSRLALAIAFFLALTFSAPAETLAETVSRVLSAEISADGTLNLRVYFPSLKQTREYGLMMQPDGTMRAIYNRSARGEYTIRDGKFAASGDPTPPQHKCNSRTSALMLGPLG